MPEEEVVYRRKEEDFSEINEDIENEIKKTEEYIEKLKNENCKDE
jgi:hypothetical protein